LQSAIPLVSDFGLAKRMTDSSQLTQSGSILGTPSYMAPEQAPGTGALSIAVDVWSLGAILFELLTGQPPFQGESSLEVLRQVIEAEPSPLRSLNPHVERDLEIICLKCLHKDPNQRYGSAESLADDLERWLAGEPIHARAASRVEQFVKWAKRRPAVAALIVVSLLAPVALLIVGLIYNTYLQLALADVHDLKQAVNEEQTRSKQAHAQAAQDAKAASDARQNAQDASKRAEQLVRQAEGLRLVAESRVVLPDEMARASCTRIELLDLWIRPPARKQCCADTTTVSFPSSSALTANEW
jgi:hypothetical protein